MRDADPPSSDTSRPSRSGRRGALVLLAGLVGAAALLPPALRRFVPLEVEPLPALPGFRRIEGEGLTRAFDPLVGLGPPDDTALPAPDMASVRADVCAALFPGWDGNSVPLAVFTDYNCAVCRRSEPELVQWVASQDRAVTLYWHELPILGPTSVVAARGALAARDLGAYAAFRARLMRSAVVADAAYLGSLANGIGLDGDASCRPCPVRRGDWRNRAQPCPGPPSGTARNTRCRDRTHRGPRRPAPGNLVAAPA